MKNVNNLFVKILFGLLLAVFLTSCGGGGGGEGESSGGTSGIQYSGSTTQVQINENNADAVATNAYQNSNAMRSANAIGVTTDNGSEQISQPYNIALAQAILNFLDQAEIPSIQTNDIYAAETLVEVEYGTCGSGGGTATYTISGTEANFTMTMDFSSYCTNGDGVNSGVVLNGTMDMQGQMSVSTIQGTITFDNLNVVLIETGVSATTSGTMSLSADSNSADITMNMVMRDDSTGKTYKVENLQVDMYNMTSYSAYFSMSGRFYDPDYGYSDITTTENFYLIMSDNAPSSGTMVINGANGVAGGSTKAELDVIDNTSYRLRADTNGDGSYDYDPGIKNW